MTVRLALYDASRGYFTRRAAFRRRATPACRHLFQAFRNQRLILFATLRSARDNMIRRLNMLELT
jgi:hypothetical protein